MKKYLFFAVIICANFLCSGLLFGQSPCLVYFDSIPGWQYGNTDSVRVDTCSGSATHGELYAKKWIKLTFKYNVINIPADTTGSLIEVSWTSIDTSYSSLRSAMYGMEVSYGTFHLRKDNPTWGDTSDFRDNQFSIRFDSLVCVDSIIHLLRVAPFVSSVSRILGLISPLNIIPSDLAMNPESKLVSDIFLNSDTNGNFFCKNWHKKGWQWNNYQIKCPMAWEITMGKSNIFIIDDERLYTSSSHPDMTANYKVITPGTNSDGTQATSGLTNDHHLACMSQATAAANNGYPLSEVRSQGRKGFW